jgi:hypothetical protein
MDVDTYGRIDDKERIQGKIGTDQCNLILGEDGSGGVSSVLRTEPEVEVI